MAPTAAVSDGAEIGDRVSIGPFCVIEDGVEIADRAVIDHHVVLRTGVRVGERTRIGSHTSVAARASGSRWTTRATRSASGTWAGWSSAPTWRSAATSPSPGHHRADGDLGPRQDRRLVFIAHNVHVGKSSFVIAGAEISGSVTIGERVWISPEVTVINKVSIGNDPSSDRGPRGPRRRGEHRVAAVRPNRGASGTPPSPPPDAPGVGAPGAHLVRSGDPAPALTESGL